MRSTFDRRIVSDGALTLVRSIQARAPAVLGCGAALSGACLGHRLSHDLDLFHPNQAELRVAVTSLGEVARESRSRIYIVRDAGTFVRASVRFDSDGAQRLELDLVVEPALTARAIEIEGSSVCSLADLRASKVTRILSRSEPRDLVDLLFLDRAGYPPEADLDRAATMNAGLDPALLGWLLRRFPVQPLPQMLVAPTVAELDAFRLALAERFRLLASQGQVQSTPLDGSCAQSTAARGRCSVREPFRWSHRAASRVPGRRVRDCRQHRPRQRSMCAWTWRGRSCRPRPVPLASGVRRAARRGGGVNRASTVRAASGACLPSGPRRPVFADCGCAWTTRR